MANIGFIGLGKLGLPVAEEMGKVHQVNGYDIVPRTSSRITVVNNVKDAVVGREFVFIAVQTPHDPKYDGSTPSSHLPSKDFAYDDVCKVLNSIAPYLISGQNVVLISTCLPGTTRRLFSNLIPYGVNFFYNPYFIAMGTVAEDFMNPEFMLIGTKNGNPEDAQPLVNYYKTFLPERVPYQPMTWTEAECTKVFYNTFISFKLSFVNMIQDVAIKTGDMNVDRVTDALCLGTNRLISARYMTAGMGDGGPCHPRDNIALRSMAERIGLEYDLYGAVMESRELQAKNMAQYIKERRDDLANDSIVVICGKAFKPGVPYTDGSYSLLVGHYLKEMGVNVNYVDWETGDKEGPGTDIRVYLLGHSGEDWHKYPFRKGSIIIDPWRSMPQSKPYHVIHYGDTHRKFPYPRFVAVMDNPSSPFENPNCDEPGYDKYGHVDFNTSFLARDWACVKYVGINDVDDSVDPWIYPVSPCGSGVEYWYTNPHTNKYDRDYFLDAIPQAVRNGIVNGSGWLLISNQMEGPIADNLLFENLHYSIDRLGIPAHRTIFVCANFLLIRNYEQWRNDTGIQERIHMVEIDQFEYQMASAPIRRPQEFISHQDFLSTRNTIRPKYYLCLNRRPTQHRTLTAMSLFNRGLVERGFMSFPSAETAEHRIRMPPNEATRQLKDKIGPFLESLPYVVDDVDLRENQANTYITEPYIQSYFNITTETKVDPGALFLSEKIYKPIANYQPFLIVGSHHSLRKLREDGYRTFNGAIDESYDEVEDYVARHEMIMKEVFRLCNMSLEELHDWYWKLEEILVHNRRVLESKTQYTDTFRNRIWGIVNAQEN